MDKCIESVRKQTLSDLEIILVENCSTDRSLEKCHAYAEMDSRIKVLHLDVGDLGYARNRGKSKSRSASARRDLAVFCSTAFRM